MNVMTLVPPAAEPLSLAEAKEYLRIAYEGEDALVGGLIGAARSRIEEIARVAMISRTLRVNMNQWPRRMERRVMPLPVRPAVELLSVRIYDAEADPETVTDRFMLTPGRVARLIWTSGPFPWPRAWSWGIEIDYVAGFGEEPDDVPEGLRLAVKRLAAHAYHSRDAGTINGPLPVDVAGLISPWRRVSL